MRSHVTMDAVGRVVIPKSVREALGLRANDVLDFKVGAGSLTLTPRRDNTRLIQKGGMWVLAAGPGRGKKLTQEDYDRLLDQVREDRDRVVRGEMD